MFASEMMPSGTAIQRRIVQRKECHGRRGVSLIASFYPPSGYTTGMTDKPPEVDAGGRIFVTAVVLSLAGAAAFMAAMSNSLTRGNNLSNQLAILGVLLLFFAGFANLTAMTIGLIATARTRRIRFWLFLSL